jgi:predicted acylesterase/phospholipase RssA
VSRLGIVCHDLSTRRPRYFGTGVDPTITLSEAVRASASIPRLFPAVSVCADGDALNLTDGGLSDPLPLRFAQRPAMGATHIVVSDCRSGARGFTPGDPHVLWIRPSMPATGTLWSPHLGLRLTVGAGEAAVTADVLRVIKGWLTAGSPRPALTAASYWRTSRDRSTAPTLEDGIVYPMSARGDVTTFGPRCIPDAPWDAVGARRHCRHGL